MADGLDPIALDAVPAAIGLALLAEKYPHYAAIPFLPTVVGMVRECPTAPHLKYLKTLLSLRGPQREGVADRVARGLGDRLAALLDTRPQSTPFRPTRAHDLTLVRMLLDHTRICVDNYVKVMAHRLCRAPHDAEMNREAATTLFAIVHARVNIVALSKSVWWDAVDGDDESGNEDDVVGNLVALLHHAPRGAAVFAKLCDAAPDRLEPHLDTLLRLSNRIDCDELNCLISRMSCAMPAATMAAAVRAFALDEDEVWHRHGAGTHRALCLLDVAALRHNLQWLSDQLFDDYEGRPNPLHPVHKLLTPQMNDADCNAVMAVLAHEHPSAVGLVRRAPPPVSDAKWLRLSIAAGQYHGGYTDLLTKVSPADLRAAMMVDPAWYRITLHLPPSTVCRAATVREAAKSAKAAAKAKAADVERAERVLLELVTPTHESVALEMKWIEYRVLIMEWARLNNNLTRDAKELCPEAKGDSSLRSVPVEVLRMICSFYCYE